MAIRKLLQRKPRQKSTSQKWRLRSRRPRSCTAKRHRKKQQEENKAVPVTYKWGRIRFLPFLWENRRPSPRQATLYPTPHNAAARRRRSRAFGKALEVNEFNATTSSSIGWRTRISSRQLIARSPARDLWRGSLAGNQGAIPRSSIRSRDGNYFTASAFLHFHRAARGAAES